MTSSSSPVFATTKWTLVAAAGRGVHPEARQALAELCEAYWYPLYAFVRRKGHQPAEAQDLTQAFFAELLEKERLQVADQSRGRFRSFLMASLHNFLRNHLRDAQALKRGGKQRILALDFERGEEQYQREPAHEWTPEKIFERRWATALLEATVARLRTEYVAAGKSDLFDQLLPHLGGDRNASYQEVAAALGTTEGAIKVAVHRLRKRCRDVLRAEIAQTVSTPEDVEEELRTLFEALET